jgi:site-specific recombinase XerD
MQTLPALISQQTLPAFMAPEVAAARGYLSSQIAESTKRAYVSDFRHFRTWCEERGLHVLPASPAAVATYLSFGADSGSKYATISRRAAAINFAHLSADLDSPTKSNLVGGALKGIRRTVGIAPVKKAPATAKKLLEMVRHCPDTLQGQRDKALLLLGFAGAFRRSELVALQVSDLAFEAAGMKATIRKSKTDQEGRGQTIAIARGEVFCPVRAVQDYLLAAGITEGAVFRPINKGGNTSAAALCAQSVADVVKTYATKAGFDPATFAGHSLRAGFLTSAAEAGANIFKMVEVSRHRTFETVRGYVRNAELFKDHAGAGLL